MSFVDLDNPWMPSNGKTTKPCSRCGQPIVWLYFPLKMGKSPKWMPFTVVAPVPLAEPIERDTYIIDKESAAFKLTAGIKRIHQVAIRHQCHVFA